MNKIIVYTNCISMAVHICARVGVVRGGRGCSPLSWAEIRLIRALFLLCLGLDKEFTRENTPFVIETIL